MVNVDLSGQLDTRVRRRRQSGGLGSIGTVETRGRRTTGCPGTNAADVIGTITSRSSPVNHDLSVRYRPVRHQTIN